MTRDRSRRPSAQMARIGLSLLALVLLLTACGSHHRSANTAPSTTVKPTTTTTKPKPKPKPKPAADTTCPLTGLPAPGGRPPQRPALAIKVENLPQARPQYGLDQADVVYEEPVEGGITRFIVIYQCNESPRVEPVRSGRWIDPDLVRQYGAHPLFAYSGAVDPVVAKIDSSPLIDVGGYRAGSAYWRDPDREAPHNEVTSTADLWAAGASMDRSNTKPPNPVFTYGKPIAGASPAASAYIPYDYSPVTWTWTPKLGVYLRSYSDTGPATLGNGGQIYAANIVIMHMVAYPSTFTEDVNGAHETLLTLTGKGPAEVIRDGMAFAGTWNRPSLNDLTKLENFQGKTITLAPGITWIELVPTYIPYTVRP